MSDDGRKSSWVRSLLLPCVLTALLCTPLGLLVGMLLGLLGDFGFRHTVENIKLNPRIFADQYGGLLVASGWMAAFCLVGAIGVLGVWWALKRSRTPAERAELPPKSR